MIVDFPALFLPTMIVVGLRGIVCCLKHLKFWRVNSTSIFRRYNRPRNYTIPGEWPGVYVEFRKLGDKAEVKQCRQHPEHRRDDSEPLIAVECHQSPFLGPNFAM
jgi:hypothetical protein